MRKQAATYTFHYTGKAPYRARRTAKVLPVATGVKLDGTAALTEETYAGMNLPYGFQKTRYNRPKDLYLVNGWVCEIANVCTEVVGDELRKWTHAFRVVSKRTAKARFGGFSGELEIRDGLIQAVTIDGERTDYDGQTLLALAALGIRTDYVEGPYARTSKAKAA